MSPSPPPITNPASLLGRPNHPPGENYAIVVDLAAYRRQRRAKPVEAPPVVALVERAMKWSAALNRGDVRNQAALAQREGVSAMLVSRMVRVARLDGRVLDLIRALPPGAPARALGLTVKGLARLADLPPPAQLREVKRRLGAAGRRVA